MLTPAAAYVSGLGAIREGSLSQDANHLLWPQSSATIASEIDPAVHCMHQSRLQREDTIGKAFDAWVRAGKAAGMERRHKRLAELMFTRFDLSPDARVLDIGCGNGWTARMLAGCLPEGAYVGIDLSAEMIRSAREACTRLDNVLFAPAAAEQIPWAEDYFTHVLSIESAYYWPDPARGRR